MKLVWVIGLMACASAPVRPNDSPAFQKCARACPDGSAFIFENAVDVACFCRKSAEGT